MTSASMGFAARLSMAAPGTPQNGYTEAHEFLSESLACTHTILETAGLRGTRSHPAERTRDGLSRVGGAIRYHATPLLLDLLLPRILGAAESSDQFALAETVPEFDVLIDRVARRFLYAGCKVNRAVFKGAAGGLLELTLELAGKTETVSSEAFPEIAAPADPPYVFHDAVLTLAGQPRAIMQFELTIDNALAVRYGNSRWATDLSARDRVVTLACTLPFTAGEADLYGANSSGAAAAALAFTNGGYALSFQIARLQIPDQSPIVEEKGEIRFRLDGAARMLGSAPELLVTNQSAP
jgi:hypothetical protein